MLKVMEVEVSGWKAALRGMRNSYGSRLLSDTTYDDTEVYIGEKDKKLMRSLIQAGPSHSKFRRMITVTMDILAPDYWWKQFDAYKIGTVSNSTSSMHTIMKYPITWDDFSMEKVTDETTQLVFNEYLNTLNRLRSNGEFDSVIQMLPMSWNYLRTVSTNYETLSNMYFQRAGHKLSEWRDFRNALKELPESWILTDG